MRILLLIILLPLQLLAKDYKFDSTHLRPPFSVFVMPCQLITQYTAGFTAGTEFRLFHRLSMSLEAGPNFAGSYMDKGFMAKANLKYYFPVYIDENLEKAWYGCIEYGYKEQSYSAFDHLTDSAKTDVTYHVRKHANTINLKIGLVLSRRGSFFFDVYGGIGARYRVVRNDLAPGETNELYHWHEGMVDAPTNDVADGWRPVLTLGWKVGYRYR
jgi:hypothetical protein